MKHKLELDSQLDFQKEFENFLQTQSEVVRLSKEEVEEIKKRPISKLVKSPFQIGAIYLGLSVVGYFLTLVVCAQNAFGFFSASYDIASKICSIPAPWCWIICGALFTGIPFLFSFAVLNRFQQKFLLFRMWWFLAGIPVLACVLILVLPDYLSSIAMTPEHTGMALTHFSSIFPWMSSALLTPYLLEAVYYFGLRQPRAGTDLLRS